MESTTRIQMHILVLYILEDLVILLAQVLNNGPIMNNLYIGHCTVDIYQKAYFIRGEEIK